MVKAFTLVLEVFYVPVLYTLFALILLTHEESCNIQ